MKPLFYWIIPLLLLLSLASSCQDQVKEASTTSPLDKIKLPDGFKIDYFAQDIDNARSLALGAQGTVFVSTRSKKKVYAVVDENQDYVADKIITLIDNIEMPNGVAFYQGDLYVAGINSIWKLEDIENNLDNVPEPILITDQFPNQNHHAWKFIRFGPDGKLYVPVGAPCNVCKEEDPIYSTITRMNPDGSDLEIYAHGVRNSVGFDWHPVTETLWFTDNGRDMMGDDIPPCEINHAPNKDMHFGFPFCHGNEIKDPEFGDQQPCSASTPPVQELGAHVAPLGMRFYTGNMFPSSYQNQIIFAEHGSWNRSKKSGYRVMRLTLEADHQTAISYEVFAEGWLDVAEDDYWGRPVDVLQMPDGSLLVSDDFADVIYRISYEP